MITDNLKWKKDSVLAEKIHKAFKKAPGIGPIMGGLITDPIPGRVRELEMRVKQLEKKLDELCSQRIKWLMEEIDGGRL